MRKAITLVSTLLTLGAHSAFAHVGGPFSFNDHNGNQAGTYQAVLTMRNGNGMCRFSEGPEAQISPFNTSIVFYRGVVYAGTCFGIVDKDQKYVQGTTNGRTNVATSSSSNALDGLSANGFGAIFVSGVDTNQTNTVQGVSSGNAQNIATCNTNWTGDVTDTAPIIEFKAEGVAYFYGELDASAVITSEIANTRTVDDTIVNAISNIALALTGNAVLSSFQDISVDELISLVDLSTAQGQSSNRRTTSTGGQSDVFPDLGVQEKVFVFGNQIGFQRFGSITPEQDGLTGTGQGAFFF